MVTLVPLKLLLSMLLQVATKDKTQESPFLIPKKNCAHEKNIPCITKKKWKTKKKLKKEKKNLKIEK